MQNCQYCGLVHSLEEFSHIHSKVGLFAYGRKSKRRLLTLNVELSISLVCAYLGTTGKFLRFRFIIEGQRLGSPNLYSFAYYVCHYFD